MAAAFFCSITYLSSHEPHASTHRKLVLFTIVWWQ